MTFSFIVPRSLLVLLFLRHRASRLSQLRGLAWSTPSAHLRLAARRLASRFRRKASSSSIEIFSFDYFRRYLQELAKNDPPSFICHFYNVYFAHTAGGRMIGNKVRSPAPSQNQDSRFLVF